VPRIKNIRICIIFIVTIFLIHSYSAKYNSFGLKHYTITTEHFNLHYFTGLEEVAKKVGDILENLYDIYKNRYNLTLPDKTEVLIINTGDGNGWALTIQNTLCIDANAFFYNMRGTCNWFENVIAHEYAHIVSIWSSFKMPAWMPYIQGGYFSHPNNIAKRKGNDIGARLEAFHIFPSEILPPWLFEGIAQYESSVNKGDSWDTHRDMILRTLCLSNTMLTWDHMSVFVGKQDNFEKVYNSGFSLVTYIAETYGYEKIVSILRESSKMPRLNFDRSIKEVLGISGKQLYKEWKDHLNKKYTKQIEKIGKQVYGRKINKKGFNNYWPRFGPEDKKVYFLSNRESDRYGTKLYSYSLEKDKDDKKRIKLEMPKVNDFYSIYDSTRNIVFSSSKSKKSQLPPKMGGGRVRDIFIDTIRTDKDKKRLFSKKTDRQVTEKRWAYHAALSPDGKKLAFTKHAYDKFYLFLADTSGKNLKHLYPPTNNPKLAFQTVYNIDWSPKGDFIAISYIDRDNRKIGLYDLKNNEFFTLCETTSDERDPKFNSDGTNLYFSSDRTGIFNIYRYNFESKTLQRLTSVSGGAFTPDISTDEKQLVFANYDKDGYGIYLIDTITVLEEIPVENAVQKREGIKRKEISTAFSPVSNYNHFPRKPIFTPTFFIENILTEIHNPYKGISSFKYGGVLLLNTPIDWLKADYRLPGIGCYFISETLNPFRFSDRNEIINRGASWDFGVFYFTKLLPVDLSFYFAMRSIAGEDEFKHDLYGVDTIEALDFNLNPKLTEITLTHNFNEIASANIFTTIEHYKIWTKFLGKYWDYMPAQGYKLGSFLTLRNPTYDSKMIISPKGLFFKLKYEFWDQKLVDREKALVIEDGKIKENYNSYQYNQVSSELIYARSNPLIKKHDIAFQVKGTALKLTDKCQERLQKAHDESPLPELHPTDLPSFYKPWEWIPGYVFYYRDTIDVFSQHDNQVDTSQLVVDTILVSGNGIMSGSISYRFPLVPTINKKLGALFLTGIYGVLNFGGTVAFDDLNDFKNISRNDLLLWRGIELRLEAKTFNTYPLAISGRWDYGIDRKAPVGGHKFTLKLGFDFDNWDIIAEPDGRRVRPRISL
jgi:Tol biopolymer transport system component